MCLTDIVAKVTLADFQLALCHIVPSMYRGLEGMVEFNSVSWEDIGGLQDVKQALKQVQLCFLCLIIFTEFLLCLVLIGSGMRFNFHIRLLSRRQGSSSKEGCFLDISLNYPYWEG